MRKNLIIRADASPQMGTGHVMRCLALAQAALGQNIPVHMLARAATPWVAERLKNEGVPHTPLPDAIPTRENPQTLLRHLREAGAKGGWVVLDGYHFGPDCHKALSEAGYKLLLIDDYAHLPEYHCDILLNQNIGSENLTYQGDVGVRLLGPLYALLRPEFTSARARAAQRIFPEQARRILLTLGGGDASAHLERLAPGFALPESAACTLTAIAGGMPEGRVSAALRDCPARVEIARRVDDMVELYIKSDICISAGGSTCWELCCLRLPFLTVETAENQHNIVLGLQERGIAPIFSREALSALLRDKAARQRRAEAGAALVDGLGVQRVIDAIMGF